MYQRHGWYDSTCLSGRNCHKENIRSSLTPTRGPAFADNRRLRRRKEAGVCETMSKPYSDAAPTHAARMFRQHHRNMKIHIHPSHDMSQARRRKMPHNITHRRYKSVVQNWKTIPSTRRPRGVARGVAASPHAATSAQITAAHLRRSFNHIIIYIKNPEISGTPPDACFARQRPLW